MERYMISTGWMTILLGWIFSPHKVIDSSVPDKTLACHFCRNLQVDSKFHMEKQNH